MSNLTQIADHQRRSRWRDAAFIVAAVVLTALSIGSVAHRTKAPTWSLTVIENPQLAR